MNNSDKVYIDCFYYGFYMDKTELNKYNLTIKQQVVKKNINIDEIQLDKLNIKNNKTKNTNKNNKKTICNYDNSFFTVLNFISISYKHYLNLY
jgi:hypothetical protein